MTDPCWSQSSNPSSTHDWYIPTDDTTSNMTAWISNHKTVVIINKYTIIKASPTDFGFQNYNKMFPLHIPHFINLPLCPQGDNYTASRGCTITLFSKLKIVHHFSRFREQKNFQASKFYIEDMEDPYWYNIDNQDEDDEKIT